jgi:hypothetical protein
MIDYFGVGLPLDVFHFSWISVPIWMEATQACRAIKDSENKPQISNGIRKSTFMAPGLFPHHTSSGETGMAVRWKAMHNLEAIAHPTLGILLTNPRKAYIIVTGR